MLILLLAVGFCFGSVRVVRPPTPINLIPRNDNPDCLAIYEITPEARFTTQGNDKAMLPPHGLDTSRIVIMDVNGPVSGGNYTNQPFASNPDIQSRAKAQSSVTALTEESATPLGFQKDTLREKHAICVTVLGVKRRWLEIMATTLKPDQSMCVVDWQKANIPGNPIEQACGNGDIYMCKDAEVEEGATDAVGFKFYCKDSCEASDTDFYWRIALSHFNTSGQQPDGENWCGYRKGDDYPQTLLSPYPEIYLAPAVFDQVTSSAVSVHPSFFVALVLSIVALFLML